MNEIQTKTLYTRAQFPIKTEEEWLELNPVLRKGEIVFVQFFDGMKTAKIGDGETPFHLLPYVDGPYEELETREFNSNILINDDSRAETIRIDSFGGMTYKCNNLIPYSEFGSTTTKNGITFTNNGDGTITVNGTATRATAFISNKFGIVEGTYTISGCPTAQNGDLNITVRLYDEATQSDTQWLLDKNNTPQSGNLTEPKTVSIAITVYAGTTVNNLVFKPMLNVGETALPYEPYFKGLQDTKPTEIKVHGANLIPNTRDIGLYGADGLTYIDNSDGSYFVSGTATGTPSYIAININKVFPAGTYTFYGLSNGGADTYRLRYMFDSKTVDVYNGANVAVFDKERVLKQILLVVQNGITVNNLLYYPMAVIGKQYNLPFIPYKEPVTFSIPDAIQSLPDYGKGVDRDYYNKINLEEQTYTESVNTIVLDGVKNKFLSTGLTTDGTDRRWFKSTSIQKPMGSTTLICSHLKAMHTSIANSGVGIIYMAGTAPNNNCYALLQDQSIIEVGTYDATTGTFDNEHSANAWLKNQYDIGNPVTVTYAKAKEATPITPLPVALDSLKKVEPNGCIEFITDNNQPIPVEVEFQVVGEA